ncbi:hypothetical protein [Streptomyces sp. NPDC051016]|uniref:hypothetical protein n=1 Tax=Streptomyces sp. NPDC051016 TaxID=3365638 RepID=UPI00379424CB
MTTGQIILAGATGGLVVLIGLILFAALAIGLHFAFLHLGDAYAAHTARRQDLKECRAIDALGTNYPKDSS